MSYPPFHPASPQETPLFMTKEEFGRAFPAESEYVERKTGVGSALQSEVVSFSNSDGGVILVGVRDDGEIAGRQLTPGLADDVHQHIGETRDPGRYSLHELAVGDRQIVVLAVARRVDGFSQTSNGRILVRRGTTNVTLFGADLRRFINERSLTRFEETDSGIPLSAADHDRLLGLAAVFGWSEDIDRRLAETGLAVPDGSSLTVAGSLYLLADPSERLGKTFIEILRFPTVGENYDKRVEIRGPLNQQVEQAVAAMISELGTELVVLGVRRYELPRIPDVVLREAISNAVAHRSYEMDGTSVRVEIYPSEVHVISPGGLPEPVTVENIRETQAARNLRVITVLRRFGLAEDAGRGVDVMEDSMRDEMLDPPSFADTGHSVVVTLPVRSAITPRERAWVREIEGRGLIEGGDRLLLVHAARGQRLTNGRAREILATDVGAARRALQRLRDQGFIDQHGDRGGAFYVLRDSLQPPAGLRLSPEQLADLLVAAAEDSESPLLTNARVRELTGLDRPEALKLLERLVAEGRLVRVGIKRGTRYVRPG